MLETCHWWENVSFSVMFKINQRLKRSERTNTCFLRRILPKETFFCVLLLSVPSPFVCLILLLSLAYLYRLHFMVELLTWPPERECNWQPSRPEAWRAKHPVRRDPGRRSSLAYVPGRQHTQNDWSPWTKTKEGNIEKVMIAAFQFCFPFLPTSSSVCVGQHLLVPV